MTQHNSIAGIVVCIFGCVLVGVVTSKGTGASKQTEENECPFKVQKNIQGVNTIGAFENKLCKWTVRSSACFLCGTGTRPTYRTLIMINSSEIETLMTQVNHFHFYSRNIYSNRMQTVICKMTKTNQNDMKISCKRTESVRMNSISCRRYLRSNKSSSSHRDECFVDCSKKTKNKIQCPDKNGVTESSTESSSVQLIGGVVGGVFGGVSITVVVVILWYNCRRGRSLNNDDHHKDDTKDSHISPTSKENSDEVKNVLTNIPDVISGSRNHVAGDPSVNNRSLENTEYRLAKTMTGTEGRTALDQDITESEGVYADIKDDELDGVRVVSLEASRHQEFSTSIQATDEQKDMYNRLIVHTKASWENDANQEIKIADQAGGQAETPDYFVLESENRSRDLYDEPKGTAKPIKRDDCAGNNYGEAVKPDGSGESQASVEYFVLEDTAKD